MPRAAQASVRQLSSSERAVIRRRAFPRPQGSTSVRPFKATFQQHWPGVVREERMSPLGLCRHQLPIDRQPSDNPLSKLGSGWWILRMLRQSAWAPFRWRARLLRSASLLVLVVGAAGCQLAGSPSQPPSLPPCASPRIASSSPDAKTAQASTEYQALVDSTTAETQSLNRRVAADQQAGNVDAIKQDFRDQIQFGQAAEARLRSIRFPAFMSADVSSYLDLIDANRQAHQEYIDARDASSRETAVQHINTVGRNEQNIVNQVRADLSLTPYPCPYAGP